jgi:hypothetical protein
MVKQISLIKLKGTIGGISFYKSKGMNLARMANGPSKERIATDSSFQRTRENNAEFGGSILVAKALRIGLSAVLHNKSDSSVAGRLTRSFKEILNKGTGVRGQRDVRLSANKTMLEGFEFDELNGFSGQFPVAFSVVPNAARNECVVTTSSFLPNGLLKAPSGGTHFRLVSVLVVVSDYVYNTVTRHYEPTDAALNQLNTVVYGATTAINATDPVTLTLTGVLPGTTLPVITDSVSVVQCLGIEFFQRIGAVDYPLAAGRCLKIVKVF